MPRLQKFLFSYAPYLIILAIVAGLLTGVANTVLIAVVNQAIGDVGATSDRLLWLFVGFCVGLPLVRTLSQLLLTYLSSKIVFDLRMKLGRRILRLPLQELEQKGPGRILSLLTHDIQALAMALSATPSICMNAAVVVSGFIYLFYLHLYIGLGSLFFALLGMVIFTRAGNLAQSYFQGARAHQDHFFEQFRALTMGAKELRLHQVKRTSFLHVLAKLGASYQRKRILGEAYFTAAGSLGQFTLFSSLGCLIFVGPRFLGADLEINTVLSGSAMVILYLAMPLEGLTHALPVVVQAAISLEKLRELGIDNFYEPEQDQPSQQELLPATWERLECRNLTYSYGKQGDEKHFHIGPIDLSFRPGELIFLIGGNGSGKTTLAKLLLGLYDSHSGIYLDGEPITEDNRQEYRQLFSAVFADFFLFENLAGIYPPEAEESAQKYLERLQLDDKVKLENQRLSTLDLSTGQRKRLALLSAFLEDRPIYLFDEWAADQDPLFKEIFYLSILPEMKAAGKTVFVISHDDHYYHCADRIIKMDYGQVAFDRPAKEALNLPSHKPATAGVLV